MPPGNAGTDQRHAITTPRSARCGVERAAQADGVRDPVFALAERMLSSPCGNRAAENDERSEQPDRVSEARAAGACPARHSLHGQRHDRVRRFERNLEMAGGELSGRRGPVHPHVGRAPHLRALHPAAHRACRVPHAAPSPSRAALGFAGLLADIPADRVQPDAARRRHRHQFLLAAVCDARLGAAAQGNSLARWLALLVGFGCVLIVTAPGAGAYQVGALFALANAILYGSVTAGVRGMTTTESAQTLTLYQLALLTGFFALLLPLGWTSPTPVDTAWIVF